MQPESTSPLPPDERAAVARLLEVAARWCDDSLVTRYSRVNYFLGYVHAVAEDAARVLADPNHGADAARIVDGLTSSLDQWCAGLANGAVDQRHPVDPTRRR
jgi:hypothetical protein